MNYLDIQGHVENLCFQCDDPFLSAKALDYHILTRHRHVEDSPKKTYKCAICKKICKDRKELYSHRLNQPQWFFCCNFSLKWYT